MKKSYILIISFSSMFSLLSGMDNWQRKVFAANGISNIPEYGTQERLRSVCFGAELYVAAGEYDGNGVIYSSDGLSGWNYAYEEIDDSILSVTYGYDFISVTSGGKIILSSDAKDWTIVFSDASFSFTKAMFANGIYMICGNHNESSVILSSFDGMNWKVVYISSDGELVDIAFGSGVWICIDYSGDVYLSVNGEAWTSSMLVDNVVLRGIAYGSGYFVAAGFFESDESGFIARSPDGMNWEVIENQNLEKFDCVAYGANVFMILGYDIIYSLNQGKDWHVQTEGNHWFDRYFGAYYNNQYFICVGGYYPDGNMYSVSLKINRDSLSGNPSVSMTSLSSVRQGLCCGWVLSA